MCLLWLLLAVLNSPTPWVYWKDSSVSVKSLEPTGTTRIVLQPGFHRVWSHDFWIPHAHPLPTLCPNWRTWWCQHKAHLRRNAACADCRNRTHSPHLTGEGSGAQRGEVVGSWSHHWLRAGKPKVWSPDGTGIHSGVHQRKSTIFTHPCHVMAPSRWFNSVQSWHMLSRIHCLRQR